MWLLSSLYEVKFEQQSRPITNNDTLPASTFPCILEICFDKGSSGLRSFSKKSLHFLNVWPARFFTHLHVGKRSASLIFIHLSIAPCSPKKVEHSHECLVLLCLAYASCIRNVCLASEEIIKRSACVCTLLYRS